MNEVFNVAWNSAVSASNFKLPTNFYWSVRKGSCGNSWAADPFWTEVSSFFFNWYHIFFFRQNIEDWIIPFLKNKDVNVSFWGWGDGHTHRFPEDDVLQFSSIGVSEELFATAECSHGVFVGS